MGNTVVYPGSSVMHTALSGNVTFSTRLLVEVWDGATQLTPIPDTAITGLDYARQFVFDVTGVVDNDFTATFRAEVWYNNAWRPMNIVFDSIKTYGSTQLEFTTGFWSTPPAAVVSGRYIFYNNSAWDDGNGAADTADDKAIAPDKVTLRPGIKATFVNYTSYSRGLNGLMIDVHNLRGTPTADDFLFRMGNTTQPYGSDPNDPSDDWPWAPAPASITVREGAGVDGADRVTLIWADNAIQKCWLQVTVLATDVTGLAANDVFYVGNAVGESGNSPIDTYVNALDEIGARNNPHGRSNPAPLDNLYDFNRDEYVNALDEILARNNPAGRSNALKLFTPPLEP